MAVADSKLMNSRRLILICGSLCEYLIASHAHALIDGGIVDA
jgi:hypothetical protein